MPRQPRIDEPGVAQHVIQRGNNRQICFGDDEDMAAYAGWLREYSSKYKVDVHAWVFMTNHVHLLATPKEKRAVSKMMQSLGRKYVQYFNFKYKRSGTLWEGRFRSSLVQSETYVLACYKYIELNPVRARMVESPTDYRWSSFSANALGVKSNLRVPHQCYLSLAKNDQSRHLAYRSLFKTELSIKVLEEIRAVTQRGLVLGTDEFKRQLSELLGRNVANVRRGRPSIEKRL